MKLSGESANFELDKGLVSSGLTIPFLINETIDLRIVLGDMYDKYDKYVIIFNSIGGWTNANSWATSLGASAINQTGSWSLGMEGLPWNNSTSNSNMTSMALFPNKFNLPIVGYGTQNATYSNGISFRKPANSIVTLTYAPYLTRTGGYAIAVATSGVVSIDFNLSFTIYGLSD